jgi:hypothetical protein
VVDVTKDARGDKGDLVDDDASDVLYPDATFIQELGAGSLDVHRTELLHVPCALARDAQRHQSLRVEGGG